MENSSYGPSPIPSQHSAAALAAFSQAGSLSEALRLSSRPFPQVTTFFSLSSSSSFQPKKKEEEKINHRAADFHKFYDPFLSSFVSFLCA